VRVGTRVGVKARARARARVRIRIRVRVRRRLRVRALRPRLRPRLSVCALCELVVGAAQAVGLLPVCDGAHAAVLHLRTAVLHLARLLDEMDGWMDG